jgi:hypothetical protein
MADHRRNVVHCVGDADGIRLAGQFADLAREVCASCPARLSCQAFALLTRPQSGVWAGLTSDQIGALADAAQHRAVRSAA